MGQVTVEDVFRKVEIVDQLYSSGDNDTDSQHLDAWVTFDARVGRRSWTGARVHVTQTAGAAFDAEVLELENPGGYDGPMDRSKFVVGVAGAMRLTVGPSGRAVHIADGVRRTRLKNVTYECAMPYVFAAEDKSGGGW